MKFRKSLLDASPNHTIADFLSRCAKIGVKDIESLKNVTVATVRHLNGDERARSGTIVNQELENVWYSSLASDSVDYSVYKKESYLAELCACYIVYSRKHLLNIQKKNSMVHRSIIEFMGEVNRVLDLGCGIGYTTAGLKSIFPSAMVTAFDMEGSFQFKFAESLSSDFGFQIVNDIQEAPRSVDLAFASEYFEHIQDPVSHLEEIITISSPRHFLIANAFGTKAIGHFISYTHLGQRLPAKEMSTVFNSCMRKHGYEKIKTKLWNNRPSLWRRNE